VVLWLKAGAESIKKRIFHRDTSSGPREYVLSQKISVDIGVEMVAGKNWSSVAQIRNICRSFRWDCFFIPLCPSIRSMPSLTAFSHWKPCFAIAEFLENLCLGLFCAELWVMIWRQAISMATGGLPVPAATFAPSLGPLPRGFYSSFLSQPQTVAAAGPKKTVHNWPPHPEVQKVLYICKCSQDFITWYTIQYVLSAHAVKISLLGIYCSTLGTVCTCSKDFIGWYFSPLYR
jgi:hypothetical protein